MNNAINFKGAFEPGARNFFRNTVSGAARKRTVVAFSFAAAISIFAVGLTLPSKSLADGSEVRTFSVDVAFGLPYVQNNVDPAETISNPNAFTPGDSFVQDGNIYPEGTIPIGNSNFDPDSAGAIGKYRARGVWTTDLANFERAAAGDNTAAHDLGFATEMFRFKNDRAIIMTDGTLPNAHFSAPRVVLGGTGKYVEIVGEAHEHNIGENKLGFCNLRVTFKVRNLSGRDVRSLFSDSISENK